MKKVILSAALVVLATTAPLAQEMKVVTPESVVWQPHPIFKGAQTAILLGDPSKPELVVQRVKFPPNYKVPPHTHPYTEVVTVLSGTFGDAAGETFDTSKGQILKAGSIFELPKGHPHYVWTTNEETVVQIYFTGPGGIEFINPADDPRKK